METITQDLADESKQDAAIKYLCRCCLSTKNRMCDVFDYTSHFRDLAGINISDSDGLPRWLCAECCALLDKAVRFRNKLVRAHVMLYEYSTRCAPFPIDAQDPELAKYQTPQLSATTTLTVDTSGRGRNGFHKVLEHKKQYIISDLNTIPVCDAPAPPLPLSNYPLLGIQEVTNDLGAVNKFDYEIVKEEQGMSDFDDDIPLDEYRSNIDKVIADDLSNLLKDTEAMVKTEDGEKKKRKKKKDDKSKKKKSKIRTDEELDIKPTLENQEEKPTIRKSIEIDPLKIKIIQLNPQEQIKQREEESKMEGYLKLPFKCSLCFKGFNYENKLMNHMQKHSPSRGKFECKLCHMYLPTPYSFNVHSLIHTRRYECLKCGRRMIDRASIVEHYRSTHDGVVTTYTCQLCGKVSGNNKTHRGHMRNHHSGARPACRACGKTFVNQDSLRDHLLIHEGVKNYSCPLCPQKFRTRTQAKHHQLKHSDVKEFYCVECDVRFKSAHNLRMHLTKSLKHKDFTSFKYGCSHCPKRFESEPLLRRHSLVQHCQVRPYECSECGARLASRASLLKHSRAHRAAPQQPSHVCSACGKAFRAKSVLQNHIRTHTGEKPYPCRVCGRRFAQRTAASTHLKLVHLKIKRGDKIAPNALAIAINDLKPRDYNPDMPAIEEDKTKMAAKQEVTTEDPVAYEPWRQQPCDMFLRLE